jgi:hypothetical protein
MNAGTARLLAVLAVATWALVSGAVACSGGGPSSGMASDGGSDGAPPDVTVGDAGTVDARDAGGGEADDASADTGVDGGPPSLTTLGVSGEPSPDASAPLALVPAFSPDVHDYYVRCAAGTNVLTISMTASAGAMSLLVQPTTSPSLPDQTLSVSVSEGQAIVAAATDGAATVEYWVRCLPHDFPLLQWTPHPGAGTRTPATT